MKKKARPKDRTVNDRVAEHRQRMKANGYRNIALMLPGDAIAQLDRLCKNEGQSRAVVLERLIQQTTTPQPTARNPASVTSNAKQKKTAKPTNKRQSKPKKPAKPATADAIGLARPEGFKDFAGAVSARAEIRSFPKMDRKSGKRWLDWQDKNDRQFISVREAAERIEQFRETHRDATIEQRYMTDDQTIVELVATFPADDDRHDQRVVFQARKP